MSSYRSSARPLRAALWFNAAFSTASAASAAVFADSLGAHFAGAPPLLFQGLAAALLVFAASLVWQATRPNPPLFLVALTIAQDVSWVVGTAILLALGGSTFSSFGLALLLAIATVVGVAAVAQGWSLSYLIRERETRLGTRHRYEVFADVDVPRDANLAVRLAGERVVSQPDRDGVAQRALLGALGRSVVVEACAAPVGPRRAGEARETRHGDARPLHGSLTARAIGATPCGSALPSNTTSHAAPSAFTRPRTTCCGMWVPSVSPRQIAKYPNGSLGSTATSTSAHGARQSSLAHAEGGETVAPGEASDHRTSSRSEVRAIQTLSRHLAAAEPCVRRVGG